jgi:hypothetical protein
MKILLLILIPMAVLIIACYIIVQQGKKRVGQTPYFILKASDDHEGIKLDIRDTFAAKRFFKRYPGTKFMLMVDNKPQFFHWYGIRKFYHYVKSKDYFELVDKII